MEKKPNKLVHETSPYLLQHAYNAVNWYPWGEEAFNLAKKENKLVLISIGYSSCHWCHVMEKEAFSDPEATSYMNEKFINIKVDREEHPEVDQIYMNAVQIITRSGGWPLNCFALPDGKPVYGGTYYPKDHWYDVIRSLNSTWENDQIRIIEVADELSNSIIGSETISCKTKQSAFDVKQLEEYVEKLKKLFDTRNGGIVGAPKFPMPSLLNFLLEYGFHFPDPYVLNFAHLTLEKIANGGIYDHIGGGFARYSVDEQWHIPHFEKMLYDNAQLISIYSKAYRVEQKDVYKSVVNDTINFLVAEMRSSLNGFYSSFDADSDGSEGSYYIWSKAEIEKLLGEDSELFSVAYGVTEQGNFHGGNVLVRCTNDDQLASIFSVDREFISVLLKRAKSKMKDRRNSRIKPNIDDKIIVSWNAMLISSLVDAYLTFNQPEYLTIAIDCISYIEEKHITEEGLKRVSCKGNTSVDALLEDYTFLIRAYYSLYTVTLDNKWFTKVEQLLSTVFDKFFDENSEMFYYSPAGEKNLIARKMDLTDGVIASSNSILAQVLYDLGNLTNNDDYLKISKQMISNIVEHLKTGGPYLYGWANAILSQQLPIVNVHLDKNHHSKEITKILAESIYPSIYLKYNSSEKSNIDSIEDNLSICINRTCSREKVEPQNLAIRINNLHIKS